MLNREHVLAALAVDDVRYIDAGGPASRAHGGSVCQTDSCDKADGRERRRSISHDYSGVSVPAVKSITDWLMDLDRASRDLLDLIGHSTGHGDYRWPAAGNGR